jgi:hypothetical protein
MDREPTSSCWWSLTNRRHWQTRNPASGPTRSALPRASRSPSAYRTRRTARLVCHRGSDLDLCLGRGSFSCLGASRFYLGVPGSSRGSVHALCTGTGRRLPGSGRCREPCGQPLAGASRDGRRCGRWVTSPTPTRSPPGRDASIQILGFGLCALVVAGVAAYASYVHQREFALQGGADGVSASCGRSRWMGSCCWPRSACCSHPEPEHAEREARRGRRFCRGSGSH